MNWKNRLTNYNFWISIFSAALLILQALKIEFDIAYVNEIFTAVLGLYNTGVFTAYLSDLFSLGFVAPYSGTVYEYLAFVAVVFVVLEFVFSTLISIAAIRNK